MKKYLIATSLLLTSLSVLSGCEKEDEVLQISDSDLNKGIVLVMGADSVMYEAVDMGFYSGTLWAKCNLGANNPSEAGFYLAWADTVIKEEYKETNYAWYDERGHRISKYCTVESMAVSRQPDNLSKMQESDDPVAHYMGGNWKTPTEDQYLELMKCTVRYCKYKGKPGFLLTSKMREHEGNSIFMPLAGLMDYEKNLHNKKWGFYWLNSIKTASPTNANVMRLNHTTKIDVLEREIYQERYLGLNIRPVVKQ